jgi:hypothetical protein
VVTRQKILEPIFLQENRLFSFFWLRGRLRLALGLEGKKMSDDIKDVNLQLLIGLKQHLEHAAQLRALLDRLLFLGKPCPPPEKREEFRDSAKNR